MRQMLRNNIRKLTTGTSSQALAFSGGTDSLCILFCMLDLGIEPALYTYALRGQDSADLAIARKVSEHFGLPLTIARIPTGLKQLHRDVIALITGFDIHGKVCIQCCHGHMYVARLVKEEVILNGSGIDGIYGSYRKFTFNGSRYDKAVFDDNRRMHLAKPNDDAMEDQTRIYSMLGQTRVVFPYRQRNIIRKLMRHTWKEINTPKLKQITVHEFPEIFDLRLFRPRGSQQIVAGTRELHDKLINSRFNKMKRRRVDEIYKDIAASFEEGARHGTQEKEGEGATDAARPVRPVRPVAGRRAQGRRVRPPDDQVRQQAGRRGGDPAPHRVFSGAGRANRTRRG